MPVATEDVQRALTPPRAPDPPQALDVQRMLWPDAEIVERLRLGRAPLLAAALCFAAGVAMARSWHPIIVLVIALCLLAALTCMGLRGSAWSGAAAVAGVWIVVGVWCAEIQPEPPSQQALLAYADGLSRTVRGRVVRVRELPPDVASDADADPTVWMERTDSLQSGAISVDLAVAAVEQVTPDVASMEPVGGGVRAGIVGDAPGLRCGDVVEMPLRLKVPERYRDPGAWQYADYLMDQGIGTYATVKAARVHRLPGPPQRWDAAGLRCRLFAAQAWAGERLLRYVHSPANAGLPRAMRLGTDDAGMLNAMLFGDRTRLSHTLRLGFERTGSFHLFVVSGMHVALLAGGVFWLARRLRLAEWLSTLITLALTAGYALLTGFGAPVQRALLMATMFLVARLLSRDRSVLNALGAAALGVLVLSPRSLFETSFQMTFLVIVAIGGMAIPLGEWSFLPYARAARGLGNRWLDPGLPPRLAQFRVLLRMGDDALAQVLRPMRGVLPALVRAILWLLELALIGIVAEMVMMLPMALYFHRATVFALPANIFSIPLVAVLAPAALLTFVASLAGSWAALVPGAATALLLHGIVGLVGRISRTQGADLRVPGPVWWVALAAVGCWFFCCWAARRSRGWALVAAVLLPIASAMVLWPEPPIVTSDVLEVTAIDVGQGDSLLVVAPSGGTMLIDAGGPTGAVKETSDAPSRFDVGEQVVSPYLWSRRLRRLDVLVLSHAHSDHMGGMAAVMRSFRPRELWVSVDPNSAAYMALLAEARELGVAVRHLHAGDEVAWGGVDALLMAPGASYQNRFAPGNDDSLVLRLVYGKASALLEGDAEAASERTMLSGGPLAPVTLLKVGHHGSRTSSTDAFVAALHPRDAVISVGRGNTFGHPRGEVIARLACAGARLYRTDEFGLTTFLLAANGSIREVTGAAER